MLSRLRRLIRGFKKVYAPTSSILFNHKLSETFPRFLRLMSGDKRDFTPTVLI